MGARTTGWTLGLLLAALAVTACGADVAPATAPASSDPGVKAGAKPGPITVTVVDSQPPGKPSNLPLSAFVSEVESRSDGSMQVEVVTNDVSRSTSLATDAAVIDGVRHGDFELAVVPARAWSGAGVTSMRSLQAPFLLESDEQVAAVVANEDLSARLLSGLDGTDVTGLVLFPEGLRHLFGFGEPILSPVDLDGEGIRMIRSVETDAIIDALGGIPVEAEDDAFAAGVASGAIRGAESSYALVSSFPAVPIATGNVVLYAKVDSLVANTAFWSGLTDDQRSIIQEAAHATRALAIRNVASDADAAARYCMSGGTVVAAEAASVERFRDAERAVLSALAEDPVTDALMTAIRGVTADLPAAPVAACEPPIATTIRPDAGELPNGIYRIEYTDEYLESWGVPDVNWQHGVWTYRLEDGHWTIDQTSVDTIDHDEGIYQVKGQDLYWRWDEDPGKPIDHVTWSVAANGDLTFAPTPDTPPGWVFGRPLIRVGPLE